MRLFFAGEPAQVIVPDPKNETSEVKKEAVAEQTTPDPKASPVEGETGIEQSTETADATKPTEAASETAPAEQTDPADNEEQAEEEEEPVELPIPRGVKKELARLAKKEAYARQLIAEAVSRKKQAEAELATVTADTKGSEPDKKTEPAKTEQQGRPVRPELENFDGDWDQFKAALAKHDADLEAWLVAKTTETVTRTVEQQMTAREQQAAHTQSWDEAVAKYGDEWSGLMDELVANTPEGLQKAISGLDNWSGVAYHLGKNPEELKQLVTRFNTNPFAAVASLGKLEQKLETPANPPSETIPAIPAKAKPKAKDLPPPPPKAGGTAAASVPVDMEKVDMRVFKREMERIMTAPR